MAETAADVLLVTDDPDLRKLVEQHQPPGTQLLVLTGEAFKSKSRPAATQLWLDLDNCQPEKLPDTSRIIYFRSKSESPPKGLPTGTLIRKPCAPVLFNVLWADAQNKNAEHATARLTPRALPSWLLDFQEIKLSLLCRKLVVGLAPRFGYRYASLYLHDPARGLLTLAETTHSRQIENKLPTDATGQHLMVAVARSGRIFQTEHAPDELAARGLPRPNRKAYEDDTCLIAPLYDEGQLWGVLNFSTRAESALTERNLPLEEIFAFLGRALHHARAFEQARTEARVDSLTGLFNQRWLVDALSREIRRAERFSTPLSVLMIDLDDLKGINDRLGHAAGDQVLRHIAQCISQILRQFDGAARVGGDEFVVMLPATALRGARRVTRRLLDAIRKHPVEFRNQKLKMNASIGAAEWTAGWDAARLLDTADRDMYAAKHNGRQHPEPPPETTAPTPATTPKSRGVTARGSDS
jgi:diguanylate cyclase (GGDEF)-like protein